MDGDRFLPLSDDVVSELADFAKDWAQGNGMIMRHSASKDKSDVAQIAPFSLLPTPFPQKLWKLGLDVQKAMNEMYFHAALDFDFISSSLENVVKTDDFTRKQLEIYQQVMKEGIAQPLVLQIQRSDYMCHVPPDSLGNLDSYELKQIEVNNIASSFAALGNRTTHLHRAILSQLGLEDLRRRLPENDSLKTVSAGVAEAWKAYGNPSSIILFVIENLNQNISDQRDHS